MKKSLIAVSGIFFSLLACSDYQAEYEEKYEAVVSELTEIEQRETIVDARDNKVYEVVQIGTQKWLAQNLNYDDGKGKCPADDKSLCKKYGRLYNANSIIKVHKGDKANGDQEIYDSLRALCPEGWHVPFQSEWKILKDYVASQGSKNEVGKDLKSVDGWFAADSMIEVSKNDIHFAVASGKDPYGFNALPAGICRDSSCSSFDNAYFWAVADTVKESFVKMLVGYKLSYENDELAVDADINYLNNPSISVRCIEGARQEAYFDSSSIKKVNDVTEELSSSSEESSEVEEPSDDPETQPGEEGKESADSTSSSSAVTASSSSGVAASSASAKAEYNCALYNCVTTEYLNQKMLADGKYGELLDKRDRQVYRTIKIGMQNWMAQNLNYNYKVGGASYGNLCYGSKLDNCSKYGKLYTWSAAMDSAGVFTNRGKGCGRGKTCTPSYTVRGICPEGWHLPDTTEWNALLKAIGGETGSAKKLKASNSWTTGYTGTDDYGFSALPTGNCPSPSECVDMTKSTDIWSSTEYSTLGAYYRYTFVDAKTPNNMILDYQNKSTARPIRCVEGDTLLSTAKSSSSVAASSSSVAKSSSSVASSSSVVKSSSSAAKSSSSIAASSSSVVKSSSSVAKSSSSVAKSSSSVATAKYDCSLYDCVTTEYLNQTMLTAGKYGEYLDTRDNQVYRTIEIGTQTWFAQNLNYVTTGSVCNTDNCAVYGRYYDWESAQKACPVGWRLSSKDDWDSLLTTVGEPTGLNIRSLYTWNGGKNTDKYGFSALATGSKQYSSGSVYYAGVHVGFWTSTETSTDGAVLLFMDYRDEGAGFAESEPKYREFSVRCLKGASQTTPKSSSSSVAPKSSSSALLSTEYDCSEYKCVTTKYLNQDMLAAGKYGEYLDTRDNQVYRTVKIGKQTWMAQNLNYEMKVSYCLNDSLSYCDRYGRLYEYDSASNACPSGWRLPTTDDWKTLDTAVGSSYKALWSTSFYSGTDDYGFSGVPTSVLDGNYASKGYIKADAGFWWSSTPYISSYNRTFELYKDLIYFGYYGVKSRLAVRCIMK